MKKNLSIKDISAMSGVSIATVSRIINKNGRYSKETEERVKAIIEENNYVPNMVAKGLRTNRMNNIGIVVPDITNEFFVQLVREIEKSLFSYTYSSFICNTNEEAETELKHLKMLRTQNVSGIIYISGTDKKGYRELLDVPTVFIDRVPEKAGRKYVVIESDNKEGGFLATSLLLKKGCRNVVMLADRRRLSSQKERVQGYLEAHEQMGVPVCKSNIIDLEQVSFQQAYDAVSALLDEGRVFDGVFASTDWLAMGAYVALSERHIPVPEKVRIVGFDDISISKYNAKPITTIHQQVDVIGQAAVRSLLDLIQNKPLAAQRHTVPVFLVERETT